jgi:drug/metabolite transporter (DMT)-like permease
MTLTTACFVGGDTCIKLIGVSLPLGEMICLIGLMSTVFLLIIYTQQGALANLPKIFTGHVLLRSLLDVTESFMFVAARKHMPLANLSSVMQSVPLVVLAMAVLFSSKEQRLQATRLSLWVLPACW